MVLPIIAAGVLSFVAFGKEILGVKRFKQTVILVSVIGVGVIGYFGYKAYREYADFKEDPVGSTMEKLSKVKEEADYVSASSLSVLLGGGTSREGYEKVQEVFVESPQIEFTSDEVGPVKNLIYKLTGVNKYDLTDCDRLVEGREAFMSPEDIIKKRECEDAGYKKSVFKYW